MAVTYKRRCRAQGLRPQAGASRDEAPLAAILNASGSSDPDGSIVPYLWHFRFRDESESHLQHNGGTYTVTLTVTDDGTLREAFSIELKLAEGFIVRSFWSLMGVYFWHTRKSWPPLGLISKRIPPTCTAS